MELSKSFPRLDLKTTLEVLLDSEERRDEIVNGFIRNFKKIEGDPEISYGINVILNHHYFKEKVKQGEIKENVAPFIDYILRNSIDYKVHPEYLREYYFYKDAKVDEKFIEVYRRVNKEFKELENEFGKNAIHVAILGSNVSKDIIKKYISKDLNEKEAIGILKVLTEDMKLSPRRIQEEVLDEIVKENYNIIHEFTGGYIISRRHERELVIRKNGSIEKLIKKDINKRITIYTNSILTKKDNALYFVYDKKKKKILDVIEFDAEKDRFIFYTPDKTIYLIKGDKVKLFKNVKLFQILGDEEGVTYLIYAKPKGIRKRDKAYIFNVDDERRDKIKFKPFWKRWKLNNIEDALFEDYLFIKTDEGIFINVNDELTIAKYVGTSNEIVIDSMIYLLNWGHRKVKKIKKRTHHYNNTKENQELRTKLGEEENYGYYLVKYEDGNKKREKIIRVNLINGKEKEIVNFKKMINYHLEDNALVIKYRRNNGEVKTVRISDPFKNPKILFFKEN